MRRSVNGSGNPTVTEPLISSPLTIIADEASVRLLETEQIARHTPFNRPRARRWRAYHGAYEHDIADNLRALLLQLEPDLIGAAA
jgi:hypothetical protein